jgi:hypothetical protein
VYCTHNYLNGLHNYTLFSISVHTYWINRARARTQTRILSGHGNSLRAGRSGVRSPVGTRFSLPVQTGPGAQPTACTTATGSFSPKVKREGRGVNHPPLSSAEIKERVELYLYSPCLGLHGRCTLRHGTVRAGTAANCRRRDTACYVPTGLLGQTVQQVTCHILSCTAAVRTSNVA